MIALVHARTVAMLLGQLERGLEEVHEQARRRVKFGQRNGRLQPLEATIADQAAHNRSVLLLHPCLVVLPIGSAARERDIAGGAVIAYRLVDEDAVVVGVEPQQGERHEPADFTQHRDEHRLLANQ